mmetsp:Transcript_23704/g.59882  ORF Transcript_23704/g.59882 Transcript_23704/m.59882 type:complete len:288 (+) Transcript_23704:905-1768(+)
MPGAGQCEGKQATSSVGFKNSRRIKVCIDYSMLDIAPKLANYKHEFEVAFAVQISRGKPQAELREEKTVATAGSQDPLPSLSDSTKALDSEPVWNDMILSSILKDARDAYLDTKKNANAHMKSAAVVAAPPSSSHTGRASSARRSVSPRKSATLVNPRANQTAATNSSSSSSSRERDVRIGTLEVLLERKLAEAHRGESSAGGEGQVGAGAPGTSATSLVESFLSFVGDKLTKNEEEVLQLKLNELKTRIASGEKEMAVQKELEKIRLELQSTRRHALAVERRLRRL